MASNIKIKTIEKLEELLLQDLAWRKKEMLSLKILVDKDQVNEPILLRAGIALLCAHFEGFIKRASNCYIGYISEQKKLYSELGGVQQFCLFLLARSFVFSSWKT